MGLIVHVLRNSCGDCTNNGESSKYDSFCLVDVPGPFQPSEKSPAAVINEHVPGCLSIVPLSIPQSAWNMFGGNFAHTSDSRFSEHIASMLGHKFYGAIPIHDRVEPYQ